MAVHYYSSAPIAELQKEIENLRQEIERLKKEKLSNIAMPGQHKALNASCVKDGDTYKLVITYEDIEKKGG